MDAEGSFGIQVEKCLWKAQNRLKLSNSGEALKLLVPNRVCEGRSNSSCKVISQKMIEKEMGDRGSNLKEQRINDSWRIGYILRLRYILTDFEINYPVKNQTKQFISIRLYSCKKSLSCSKQ